MVPASDEEYYREEDVAEEEDFVPEVSEDIHRLETKQETCHRALPVND